jgi:hypothetical protein
MAINKDRGKTPARSRSYKADMPAKVSISVGESFTGVFQSAQEIEITDKKTGQLKPVMQYLFRDEKGQKCGMLGAFQLDMCFEEVFEKEGGQEKVQGLKMTINRGDDSKLPGKRTMGNYEITVWDAD